jgi:hypothetical protein
MMTRNKAEGDRAVEHASSLTLAIAALLFLTH